MVLDAADHELVLNGISPTEPDPLTRNKLEILAKLGDASAPIVRPRIRLAYRLTPQRVLGDDRVEGIEFTATGTDEIRQLDAGLVLTSIGYRGKPIRDLPFDDDACVVPNEGGRVIDPASCTGARCLRRRLDQARADGLHRHQQVVRGARPCTSWSPITTTASHDPSPRQAALGPPDPRPPARGGRWAGWQAIDRAEIARGGEQRPRNKFTAIPDMLAAAATAPSRPLARRILAGLFR